MLKFFGSKITSLLRKPSDPFLIDKIEEIFYDADFGSRITEELVLTIKDSVKHNHSYEKMRAVLCSFLLNIIENVPNDLSFLHKQQFQVFLIIGANGTGKTTSIAKLAHFFSERKKKVLIVSTDVFRAAAQEQLSLWTKKLDCDFIQAQPKQDPASVAFDGIHIGLSKKYDVLLLDTSGRLHTNSNLMRELSKIRRVCGKADPASPHETMMIIDATLGQNVTEQVKAFNEHVPVSRCILTKMDGTAKGGTIFNIYRNLRLPVSFVGNGENLEDFHLFDPKIFVENILPDKLS